MRVFFIGTVLFSESMLKTLFENPYIQIVGIATKSNSSFNSDHVDLSYLAIQNEVPYKYVKDINAPHVIDWISSLNPDIIFCLGWSSLIKKDLLTVTKFGVVGYHPSELPKNRGRHPIIWALVLGLKYTASTFFLMDEGADSGDIISQEVVTIFHEDNSASLYQRLTEVAIIQINSIVDLLQRGSFNRVSQKGNSGNHWRKRFKVDGLIDWRMRSIDIYNLVRALDRPYPGAHFKYQGKEIKVWKCEMIENSNNHFEPGKILEIENNSITIKSCDGAIKLLDHELIVGNIEDYII